MSAEDVSGEPGQPTDTVEGWAIGKRSDYAKWVSQKLFTTGEAAEICKVSQQTIIRAFDAGKLRGFRVPGSRFRRILRDELIRYMKASNIPTDTLEGRTRRILVVDDDSRLNRALRKNLPAGGPFEVEAVSTGYDAGVLTEQFKPHLIIVGDALPDLDVDNVCTRLRAHPDLTHTKVIVLSRGEELPANGKEPDVDCVVRRPVSVKQLVQQVKALLPF